MVNWSGVRVRGWGIEGSLEIEDGEFRVSCFFHFPSRKGAKKGNEILTVVLLCRWNIINYYITVTTISAKISEWPKQ